MIRLIDYQTFVTLLDRKVQETIRDILIDDSIRAKLHSENKLEDLLKPITPNNQFLVIENMITNLAYLGRYLTAMKDTEKNPSDFVYEWDTRTGKVKYGKLDIPCDMSKVN